MKRIRKERATENGWTKWVQPVRRGYLMQCCDCGLVHRMNFRIQKGRVQFKAQRAVAYTRKARRSSSTRSEKA